MVAVHQHFGLDDRNDVLLLAERRVTRERVGVGHDGIVGRDAGADIDHGAPFGELGAQPAIFDQPLAQAVEALGDDLARAKGSGLVPLSTLIPGSDPVFSISLTSGVPSLASCRMVSS